jgi:ABC-2 type transport system ATP-binding protein
LFVTTHYMEEAERCNRIAFLHTGRLVALGTPASLKTTGMDADVVRLTGPDPYAIYRELRGAGLALDAHLYGSDVHAVVSDARAALPRLLRLLERSGHAITSGEVVQPSIEDVFVRLMGRS